MKYLVLDTETTTKNSGNPFTVENRLCLVSWATANESGYFKVDYDDEPYAASLSNVQRLIDECDVIVGFNIKFDLHWLRRYGINFTHRRIWDCQLVEYMLAKQTLTLPSLNTCAARHDLGAKHGDSVVDLWNSGIDTHQIPLDVLAPYAVRDAELTRDLYLAQFAKVINHPKDFQNLVTLHNADLLVTEEMEWNGIFIDIDGCLREAAKIKHQVDEIDKELKNVFGIDWINWESPKQLSTLLFGGTLTREWREQVGTYKSGQKIGQPRYSVRREEHEFRRLVEPTKGTELANGGWSTSEDSLRSLRPRDGRIRNALDLLLRRSKLEKLRGTYFEGLPQLVSSMGWKGNCLHGQINHVIARTGRTTSSKPNLQNMPPEIDRLFRSRFSGGFVAGADAKGLEWVCIVYQSQDPVGIAEVNAGVDQHEMNKAEFSLPEKRVAKYFVFRLIYGGVARTYTKDPDFNWISKNPAFWQEVMDKFYDKYKGIAVVHKEWFKNAVENGDFVTPSGRMFTFTPDESGNWDFVRPVVLNYPVQSFGADLMAIARVSMWKRMKSLGLKSVLINTIHDSIVVDIHPEEWYTIRTLVEEVFRDIPLNFERIFRKPFNLKMTASIKRLDGEEINEDNRRESSLG